MLQELSADLGLFVKGSEKDFTGKTQNNLLH
jgi:hypothetical protein